MDRFRFGDMLSGIAPAMAGAPENIWIGFWVAGLAMPLKISLEQMSFAVVEDNRHMRDIIRILLKSFGAKKIHEAEDGAAGLELIGNCEPDVLITDWCMPLIDGIELVRLVRRSKIPAIQFLPIILLTAHSQRNRVIEARNAGVDEFLCKPISAKMLYQRIAHMVQTERRFVRTKSYFGPERRGPEGAKKDGGERRSEDVNSTISSPVASVVLDDMTAPGACGPVRQDTPAPVAKAK